MTMEGDGNFTIKSQANNSCCYNLQFGQDNIMPSCSCSDWQRHHWPCKHFLAVFHYFPEWGWEAMSTSYSSSPYFRVDQDVIIILICPLTLRLLPQKWINLKHLWHQTTTTSSVTRENMTQKKRKKNHRTVLLRLQQ